MSQAFCSTAQAWSVNLNIRMTWIIPLWKYKSQWGNVSHFNKKFSKDRIFRFKRNRKFRHEIGGRHSFQMADLVLRLSCTTLNKEAGFDLAINKISEKMNEILLHSKLINKLVGFNTSLYSFLYSLLTTCSINHVIINFIKFSLIFFCFNAFSLFVFRFFSFLFWDQVLSFLSTLCRWLLFIL